LSQQVAGGSYSLPVSFEVLGSFLAADFNQDDSVDGLDLAAWKRGYCATGASKNQGDANEDGIVDGEDFIAWQQAISAPPASAVPEPPTVGLSFALAGVVV
jgi:hypothetical protein